MQIVTDNGAIIVKAVKKFKDEACMRSDPDISENDGNENFDTDLAGNNDFLIIACLFNTNVSGLARNLFRGGENRKKCLKKFQALHPAPLTNVTSIDYLLVSEWITLDEVCTSPLDPSADLTDLLQRDSQTQSSIIPVLLNMEFHLPQCLDVERL